MKRLLVVCLACVFLVLVAAPALADLQASRVTCATTATLAYTAPQRGGTFIGKNAGANPIFLGNASVTTANGFELAVGAGVSVPMFVGEKVYCIVAAATERLDKIEVSRVP